MQPKTVATAQLKLSRIPPEDASVDALNKFAHTFDGYQYAGSAERCGQLANARDYSSIDKLRACLFFEARRWRHFGEDPDEESLRHLRSMVAELRDRLQRIDSASAEWLADAIERLPSDARVPDRTQGYNTYNTQREHWLGWLNPAAGTGTYPRKTGQNAPARLVYGRIGEPKMLLWLAGASGVEPGLLAQAENAARRVAPLASKCAAIRKAVPWRVVAEALLAREQSGAA